MHHLLRTRLGADKPHYWMADGTWWCKLPGGYTASGKQPRLAYSAAQILQLRAQVFVARIRADLDSKQRRGLRTVARWAP